MKCVQCVQQSLLLISLMLLASCQAQPTGDREQRQLKSPATGTEADVKMMTSNMTPAMTTMQLPMSGNPMGMQMQMGMARYPGYSGLVFGGGAAPAAPYPGYPTDPSLGLGYGLGLGAYSGHPQAASGFMYPQLGNGNGFGSQPGVDNFAALHNIINMANVQGFGAAPPTGLYPQAGIGAGIGGVGGVGVGGAGVGVGFGGVPGVGMPIPGYFGEGGNSIFERMNMHHYAPAF
ncbi:hypothetical protein ACLKA6_009525 [Drosophila palustris]